MEDITVRVGHRQEILTTLCGVQKNLCAQISKLNSYRNMRPEACLILETYIALAAVTRYLHEIETSVAYVAEIPGLSTERFANELEFQVDYSAALALGKTVYTDLIEGATFVPDVVIGLAQKMTGILVENELDIDVSIDMPSILRGLSDLLSTLSLCVDIGQPVVSRNVEKVEAAVVGCMELSALINRYLASLNTGIQCDVSLSLIIKQVAVIADYYGQSIHSVGKKTLNEFFYIKKGGK